MFSLTPLRIDEVLAYEERSYFRRDMIKWCSVLLLLILTFFQGAYAADDISGNAQLTYRSSSTKTEHKEKLYGFNQTYNLGLRKDITPRINFTTDLTVNTNKTDDTSTTRLFPTFRLNITNRYFDANAGYQLTEQGLDILGVDADETRRTTERWNVNLATKSDRYPQIRYRYEEDATSDDLSLHEIDTLSRLSEYTADYTYQFLNFSGKYYKEIDDNFVEDSTQTTTIKEGRVEFRKSFWVNKITSSGSYRWTEQEIELKTRSQGVEFRIERDRNAGLYVLDASPTGGALNPVSSLIDGNLGISTGINIDIGDTGSVDQNVGAELARAEDVEEIWIYTDVEYTHNNTHAVEWEVYYANDNIATTTWQEIPGATSEYVRSERRFVISFTAPSTPPRYFKVVNTTKASPSFPNLFVTEIRLFGGLTTQAPYTTTSATDTRQNIIFDAGIRPADWMRITYNFTQNKAETEPVSNTTRQSTHNISVRADADLYRYLKAWAQYQLRLEYDTESDRRQTDTYSLHFESSPLTTLNASLSFAHSVPKVKSETQSRTTSSLLHIAAALLEGVDLSVDGDLHYTDDIVNDTVTFIRTVDSDLRVQLTKTLTTEMKYTKNWTTIDNSDGTETSERNSVTRADLYYRPDRRFYFRGSYELRKDQEGHESCLHQVNINHVMTDKLRLDLGYTRITNTGGAYTYSADLVWNLSRVFVLRFVYDLSRQKEDAVTKTQTFTSILSAKF